MMEGEQQQDQMAVRAAKILVGLRHRELRRWPEWVPIPPPSGEACSSAASARVPEWWPTRKHSGTAQRRGDWKKALRELLGPAAAAAGSGPWASRIQEGTSHAAEETPAAPERRPVEPHVSPAGPGGVGAGPGPSTTKPGASASRGPETKEALEASSPKTPLDMGAGGSGASSSVDDAVAKRKCRGSGPGAASVDDEGCSSPAKRARVAAQEEEEKPISAAVGGAPRTQSEACASGGGGGKGGGLGIDLNLPWPHDDDGGFLEHDFTLGEMDRNPALLCASGCT